jgi:hypothetical protein
VVVSQPSEPERDLDPERQASIRRRERLLDRIAREREAFRAKEKELSLERLRLAQARATTGYRIERAIRRPLHAVRTHLPGGNPASAGTTEAGPGEAGPSGSSVTATVPVRSPSPPTANDGPTGAAGSSGEGRRVAIHIGAPTWDDAARWGDLPFARDIEKAFRLRGWSSSIHVAADRDRSDAVAADLAIHVAGIRVPPIRPGQASLLWIISHPDSIRRETCLGYDLVGVASDPFLDYLRSWLGPAAPAMIPLHQATDPDRFFPEAGGPAHEILFVGSARDGRRPFLDALAASGHDLAVYGRNWSAATLDPKVLHEEWISNDDLHRYYAAAAISLSDSWADMRDEGFIPNRIYDALASGAFVISEEVPGLGPEFDGSVVAYRDIPELLARVDQYLADPAGRADRAAKGRQAVLARHTFQHRVDAIIEAIEPLLVGRP